MRPCGYEAWIIEHVVPWIRADTGGVNEIATLGCSLGGYHAANFALKRADLFPLALCFSGNYVWGFDSPHDWPSWQRQLSHHLPRFC